MLKLSRQGRFWHFVAAGIALMILPLGLQFAGNAWVRIVDLALLYIMLALGLNIVVGFAGLLDLGYVALCGWGLPVWLACFAASD